MEALLEPLRELAEIEEIQKEKKEEAGLIQITGCVGSQKTHLICALGSDCKYKLIVTSGESKAKQMYEEYRFLKETVYQVWRKTYKVLPCRFKRKTACQQ